MKMQSMVMSEEEQKEQGSPSMCMDPPKYPYGLRISLEDDALDKLGLVALPQVGQKLLVTAKVEVQNVSSYQTSGGDVERSVSLQITDMALGPDQSSAVDPAEALYGKKKG